MLFGYFATLFRVIKILQIHTQKNQLFLHYNGNKMAPRSPRISLEWAESLVGLAMKVPESWWPGYKSHKLCDGRIDSYCPISQRWNLLLNTKDDDALYLM